MPGSEKTAFLWQTLLNKYSLMSISFQLWYYTSWAKAFYMLLCCALIVWTIHFFRVKNRLKLKHLEKEKILEQSRAKLEFFTNLSHDLKTPLGMIIAPISRMLPEIRISREKK